MRLRLLPTRRLWPYPAWATAVVAVWFCLAAGATWLSARCGTRAALCPVRLVVGIPCPTCGTGRAGLCVLEGRLLDAWRLNPLVCTVGLGAALALLGRLAFRRQVTLDVSAREQRTLWWAGAVLLLLNWCYVVVCVG